MRRVGWRPGRHLRTDMSTMGKHEMDGASAIIDLSVEEVMSGMADGSMIVVDVREPQELAQGMIPGSVAMPLSRFDPSELPAEPGKRLVFSCAGGVRSRHAIAMARASGLDLSEHLATGFKGWLAAGGPAVRQYTE